MVEALEHEARRGIRLDVPPVDVELALDAHRLARVRHRDARELAQTQVRRMHCAEHLEPALVKVVDERAQGELRLARGHVPEAAVEQLLEGVALREPGEAARGGKRDT